jgi:hypothetical protein
LGFIAEQVKNAADKKKMRRLKNGYHIKI